MESNLTTWTIWALELHLQTPGAFCPILVFWHICRIFAPLCLWGRKDGWPGQDRSLWSSILRSWILNSKIQEFTSAANLKVGDQRFHQLFRSAAKTWVAPGFKDNTVNTEHFEIPGHGAEFHIIDEQWAWSSSSWTFFLAFDLNFWMHSFFRPPGWQSSTRIQLFQQFC